MAEQYGMVIPLSFTPVDPDAAAEELRRIAQKWAMLGHLRVIGDVEIIRHRDVSELDWRLMDVDADWQPGAEVWGWKMQAERDGSE